MKVIAAGFPKTGTKSMNVALTELGFNVYDAPENFYGLVDEYAKIYRDGWTTEDFRRMYKDVDAVVDSPACHFWEEIYKAFPDAKIILTMRKSEDVWYESFKNHTASGEANIVVRLMEYICPTHIRFMRTVGWPNLSTQFGISTSIFRKKVRLNEAMLKLKYRSHNAYVMQNAPKEQLLVFNCSEGWEPLCKFLGVPVPDKPFPKKNVRGGIIEELMKTNPIFLKMQREMMLVTIGLFSAMSICGYSLYKVGPRGIYHHICSSVSKIWQRIF